MSAIEIYTKIISAIDGENPEDVNIAMQFASRKAENRLYAEQAAKSQIAQGLNSAYLSAGIATAQSAHAEALKLVRTIAQEEIAKSLNQNGENDDSISN